MRISKVKVTTDDKKQKMVLMHRTIKEGSLVYEKETDNQTNNILPRKKKDSFNLSILNKTLINEKHIKAPYTKDFNEKAKKEKELKYKYSGLKKILQAHDNNDMQIKNITEGEITPFLSNKFKGDFTYRTTSDVYTFNLTQLIINAVKKQDIRELKPYNDWKDWYIQNKSKQLAKSVEQNKIYTQDGNSKRQLALQEWEKGFLENGSINLDDLHKAYKTDELAAALISENPKNDDEKPKRPGVYHSALKNILQAHQRRTEIFGTRECPNSANRADNLFVVYHNEVVKYLEHYFPVKQSSRKYEETSIRYHLNADTIKLTIKNQIENALRANLIRKGKYIQHQLAGSDTVSSKKLITMKADEAFVLKLIDACAFAANNICNIIDLTQNRDILVKENLIYSISQYSISQKNANIELFNQFFPYNTNALSAIDLWALRGAVQKIRNNINHYKANALSIIFNVVEFEYPKLEKGINEKFEKSIYKSFFEKDIEKLPTAFALQLKSGGVLSHYPKQELKNLLKEIKIELCRSVTPFAPGFKKVMRTGINYQFAKEEDFYDLGLSGYREKEKFKEESWNARYFMLKQLYNYVFLPQFMSDKAQFHQIVKFVLDQNKAFAREILRKKSADKKNLNPNARPKAYAFAEVREMGKEEDISTYMAYLQSDWMLESSKKEEKKNAEEETLNFEKFVLQVFVKAFDEFLKAPKYTFIQTPENQWAPESTPEQQANALNSLEEEIREYCHINTEFLKPDNNADIAFYVFCKLLDTNHLSDVRNELIKYRAVKEDDKIFKHLLSIVEFCLLSADTVSADAVRKQNDRQYFKRIQPFFATDCDPSKLGELYLQSDNATAVLHSGIKISEKYGTLPLMEKIIQTDNLFLISKKNADDWHTGKSIIEKVIKEREKLHNEWVKAKETDEKERKEHVRIKSKSAENFINNKGNEYAEICEYIDTYNWLDNKLHFIHLKRLHNLTVEILGRLAGFVAVWERDFQYLEKRRAKTLGLTPLSFDKGLPSYKNNSKNVLDEFEAYHLKTFLCKDYRNIRKRIAHYEYLNASVKAYSLIDLINQVRQLLSYDRKLKNAVAKSIITLFEKHGMQLKLTVSNTKHQLEIQELIPVTLNHLGTNAGSRLPISTNRVHKQYCAMCRALLQYRE